MNVLKSIRKHAVAGCVLLFATAVGIALSSFVQFDLPAEKLEAKYATGASRFLELSPGLRVHYRDEGPENSPDAPTLVLIHGTASSLHTFDELTRKLAKDYRVLRFDLPGFGLTGPCTGCDYSPTEDAEFVRSMLDALGIPEPVTLVGNSLGGRIAWEFALRFPDRARGLVLLDSLGYLWPDKPLAIAAARIPVLGGAQRYITPYFLIQQSLREVYGDDALISRELVDRHFELLLREGNRAAFIQRVNHELDVDEAKIPGLNLPTLVLWGADDEWVPAAHSPKFVRDIPGARQILYAGVGHVPHEEAPERVALDLRAFFNEL
ncbi:MAG: alpha/beta hydrolase [bacterium]|nr:alpha/beta hydrolase [bacterium]